MDDYESLSSSESRELCGIAYARVMTRLRIRFEEGIAADFLAASPHSDDDSFLARAPSQQV
jgi:hypothetical protein